MSRIVEQTSGPTGNNTVPYSYVGSGENNTLTVSIPPVNISLKIKPVPYYVGPSLVGPWQRGIRLRYELNMKYNGTKGVGFPEGPVAMNITVRYPNLGTGTIPMEDMTTVNLICDGTLRDLTTIVNNSNAVNFMAKSDTYNIGDIDLAFTLNGTSGSIQTICSFFSTPYTLLANWYFPLAITAPETSGGYTVQGPNNNGMPCVAIYPILDNAGAEDPNKYHIECCIDIVNTNVETLTAGTTKLVYKLNNVPREVSISNNDVPLAPGAPARRYFLNDVVDPTPLIGSSWNVKDIRIEIDDGVIQAQPVIEAQPQNP
jgi:hypothetical protein